MTPAARVAAAIGIVDQILDGQATEAALLRWARASRFAGSKDRVAVRDLVFMARRMWASSQAVGGGSDGRAIVLGALVQSGADVQSLFSGQGYGPAALSQAEIDHLATPPTLTQAERADLPDWLWGQLQADYGADAMGLAQSLQARAPVFLRVNAARGDRDTAQSALEKVGIVTRPVPEVATALEVTEGARRVQSSAPFLDGQVELQDAASQAVVQALGVGPDQTVLDYCAGGGGKALALAAYGAKVTAHDADAGRLRPIADRAERAGADIIVMPPETLPPEARFDLVLCDVPCSGSGAWRRSPDGKWTLTQSGLDSLNARQLSILTTASAHVAAGGRLAYVTCSVLSSENTSIVAQFGAAHPDWHLKAQHSWRPGAAGDGFFLAILERR